MLFGFKAQHRPTGKFHTVWAEDDADARVRIAGYLKVPISEIMRALPSQDMGPNAIRFDPKTAAVPAAPPVAASSAAGSSLPWQFPVVVSPAGQPMQNNTAPRGGSSPAFQSSEQDDSTESIDILKTPHAEEVDSLSGRLRETEHSRQKHEEQLSAFSALPGAKTTLRVA